MDIRLPASSGIRPLVGYVAILLVSTAILFGQKVGDPESALVKLGKPMATRKSGDREMRLYTNGLKITLERGIIAEIRTPDNLLASSLPDQAVAKPAPTVSPTPAPARPAQAAPAGTPTKRSTTVSAPTKPAALPKPEIATAESPRPRGPSLVAKILGIIGVLIFAGCNLGIIITAFRAHPAWGLAVLFVPCANLLFAVTHWQDTKVLVLTMLLGAVPLFVLCAVLQ